MPYLHNIPTVFWGSVANNNIVVEGRSCYFSIVFSATHNFPLKQPLAIFSHAIKYKPQLSSPVVPEMWA